MLNARGNKLVPASQAWDLSPREAAELQRQMASSVKEEPLRRPVQAVAGVDVSIRGGIACAAVVVMAQLYGWALVRRGRTSGPVQYPYVPGLLAFREIPQILQTIDSMDAPCEVFMVDGHGRLHPRRFGLACHLGVLLDMPCVGVAKRPYGGVHEELPPTKGATAPLRDRITGKVLGMAVRTRTGVRPVYVSVGHKVTLDDAVQLTLDTTLQYRLPEPTRRAHHLSRQVTD